MKFFITGTHAYGPVNPDSDLDIVVMANEVQVILDFLADHGIEYYRTPGQDSYGDAGGFYFDLGGIEVNIIIAADAIAFKEWKRRTEKMKDLAPIEDREERVAVFNEKEEFKGN